MTPDVNVLLAAARSDHVHHRSARAWLKSREDDGGQTLLLMPMVLAGFLRLVIHPMIFASPSRPDEAFAFVDKLLEAPCARTPAVGANWSMMRSMYLAVSNLKPNDVPDVWLAAAVRQSGDHLVTFDSGFRRLLKRSELTILA